MPGYRIVRNSCLGAVIGLAVGDALGAPFRKLAHYQIELKYGGVKEMTGGGCLKLKPGEWTDETAQAVLIAKAYTQTRELEAFDVAIRLIQWAEKHPKDMEISLRDALMQIKDKPEKWEEYSRLHWFQSKGTLCDNLALARASFIPIAQIRNLGEMVSDTITATQITHFDPRCVEAALAINFILFQCANGNFNSRSILSQTLQFLDSTRKQIEYRSRVLEFNMDSLRDGKSPNQLPSYLDDMDAVSNALKEIPKKKYEELGATSYVVHTMQTAIWILLNSNSYESGVRRAASLGGEADTQAALAGAMLGARMGLSDIPDRWQETLLGHSKIVSLAEVLLGQAYSQPKA